MRLRRRFSAHRRNAPEFAPGTSAASVMMSRPVWICTHTFRSRASAKMCRERTLESRSRVPESRQTNRECPATHFPRLMQIQE